jgi:hypothetical protein
MLSGRRSKDLLTVSRTAYTQVWCVPLGASTAKFNYIGFGFLKIGLEPDSWFELVRSFFSMTESFSKGFLYFVNRYQWLVFFILVHS